eukprot:CFRG6550T1
MENASQPSPGCTPTQSNRRQANPNAHPSARVLKPINTDTHQDTSMAIKSIMGVISGVSVQPLTADDAPALVQTACTRGRTSADNQGDDTIERKPDTSVSTDDDVIALFVASTPIGQKGDNSKKLFSSKDLLVGTREAKPTPTSQPRRMRMCFGALDSVNSQDASKTNASAADKGKKGLDEKTSSGDSSNMKVDKNLTPFSTAKKAKRSNSKKISLTGITTTHPETALQVASSTGNEPTPKRQHRDHSDLTKPSKCLIDDITVGHTSKCSTSATACNKRLKTATERELVKTRDRDIKMNTDETADASQNKGNITKALVVELTPQRRKTKTKKTDGVNLDQAHIQADNECATPVAQITLFTQTTKTHTNIDMNTSSVATSTPITKTYGTSIADAPWSTPSSIMNGDAILQTHTNTPSEHARSSFDTTVLSNSVKTPSRRQIFTPTTIDTDTEHTPCASFKRRKSQSSMEDTSALSEGLSTIQKSTGKKGRDKSASAVKKAEERERKKIEKERERLARQQKKDEEKQAREEERANKRRKLELEKERKEAEKTAEKAEAERVKQEQKDERERIRLAKEEEKRAVQDARNKERADKEAKIEAKRLEKEKEEAKIAAKKRKQAAMFSNFFKGSTASTNTAHTNDDAQKSIRSGTNNDANAEDVEKMIANEFEEYFIPFEVQPNMKIAPACPRDALSVSERTALDSVLHSVSNADVQHKTDECITITPTSSKNVVRAQNGQSSYTASARDESIGLLREFIQTAKSKKWRPHENEILTRENTELACLSIKNLKECSGNDLASFSTVSDTRKVHLKLLQFHDNYRPPYFGTWSKNSDMITGRTPFKQDSELFDYDVNSDLEWEEEPEGESLSDDEKEADGDEDAEDEEDGFVVPHGYLSDDEGVGEGEDGDDDCENKHKKPTRDKSLQTAEARAVMGHARLRPVVVGCLWEDGKICEVSDQLRALRALAIVPIDTQTPINLEAIPKEIKGDVGAKPLPLTDAQMVFLLKLVCATNDKLKIYSDAFREQHPQTKIKTIKDAIRNFATREKRNGELRWWVKTDILIRYGIEAPSVPVPEVLAADATPTGGKSPSGKNQPSIVRFFAAKKETPGTINTHASSETTIIPSDTPKAKTRKRTRITPILLNATETSTSTSPQTSRPPVTMKEDELIVETE